MDTMTTDAALEALTKMRALQDKLEDAGNRQIEADREHAAALAELRAAEIEVLQTTPTSIKGALELLRFAAVELTDREADLGLVAAAILRAAAVIERECNDFAVDRKIT